MRIASFFISLFLTLFLFSCTTTEPPEPPPVLPALNLTEDDTHCTETWLKLTTENLEFPAELILKQYNPSGDSLSFQFSLTTDDTLFYINSLLPDQDYSFRLFFNITDNSPPSSNILNIETMDTTSHDFTFDMLTFGGETGSSSLHDVAIINKNNIWAVGNIYIKDSSDLGYTNYNAVHWDGNSWELKRILYLHDGIYSYGNIYAVQAFAEDDIWFGAGNLIHWDGHSYNPIETGSAFSSLINEMWGTGTDNLYIVGNDGNIALYDGTYWQKIESGTELNINDILGDYNEKTREWEIIAVASDIYNSFEKEVLKIELNNTFFLDKKGIDETLASIWFSSGRKYFLAGSGTYIKTNLSDSLWNGDPLDQTSYYEHAIMGNDINDIFVVCAFGEILHFNGYSWKNYQLESPLFNGTLLNLATSKDVTVIVGRKNSEAVIYQITKE